MMVVYDDPGLMSAAASTPFDGMTKLLVDGTNLLHALSESAAPVPAASLIGRLRSVVPPGVAVVVALDGSPVPGGIDRRVASGIEVRYAGRRPADELIRDLAAADASTTLVVTDDRELRFLLARQGVRTAGALWLLARLAQQRLVAPAAGRPRAPVQAGPADAHDGGANARPAWRPGRGATRKLGNPRRSRRSRPG